MKEFNAGLIVFVSFILLQFTTKVKSFGLLKAVVSPPMPRFTRIKNLNPREIRALDPHAVPDFMGLVKQHNYPAEEHNVTTIDGYRLILHRIPSSPKSPPMKKKPAVLIQHGILASSDTWVLFGPSNDLAFLLADAGYDVWVGNFRGNTYSRSHMVLTPEDPAFWQFSFHEMGYYDLPAMIDYILEHTSQKSLTYVGHSMGTTCSYILLSTRPEYNKRLRLVISLAPVAFWKHKIEGFQKLAADNANFIERTCRSRGIFELIPQSNLVREVVTAFCSDVAVTQAACVQMIFSVAGFDYQQLNFTTIPYIATYFPAGMSLKTLYHYYQNLITGDEFRQFDYGYIGNFQRYGMQRPPQYDVTKITAPVALFYGLSDHLSQEVDVKELMKRLPNVVMGVPVPYKSFNHLDFLWAKDAKPFLYEDVVKVIHRFK